MTPDDRRIAREALEQGRLSIAQVEAIKADVESSGRPFLDAARARGFLVEPLPAPRAFQALIVGAAVLLIVLFAYTIRRGIVDLGSEAGDIDETAHFRIDTEGRSYQARKDYEKAVVARDEAQAKSALEKGRAALKAAQSDADLDRLNEAVEGLTLWLDRHPDDVDALLDRAKASARSTCGRSRRCAPPSRPASRRASKRSKSSFRRRIRSGPALPVLAPP